MKVLAFLQWFLKPLLDPTFDPRIHKYAICFSSFFLVMAFAGTSFYIVENVNDVTKIAQPFYLNASVILTVVKFFIFNRRKAILRDSFEALQVNVDSSE